MLSSRFGLRAITQVSMFLLVAVATISSSSAQTPYAAVVSVDGIINPAMASYVDRAIGQAEDTGASVIVMTMDTPGGLDTSMRDIIQRMISSKVPIVVYVSPSGARAASAGVYLTYAAQIAAMAPSTNIGSAHPVALDQSGNEQQMTDTMTQKVTNDAVAYIRGLAQSRGRNADWAEQAVRNSVNITAQEALDQKVINVIADDVPSLLDKIDGTTVQVPGGSVTLKTKGLPIQQLGMSPIEGFLHAISDPTIAYILLSLGTLGLIFELSSPGAILPGVVGGLFLLFALFGLGTLPINMAGLLLIGFAFLLFVVDIVAPTHGILTGGGVISFVLGSFMLINTRDAPFLSISTTAIGTLTLALTGFFIFVVRAVVKSRRRTPTTGREGMLGQVGRAKTELAPGGMVFVDGALWEGISDTGTIAEGEAVEVVGERGLTLVVRRVVPTKELVKR